MKRYFIAFLLTLSLLCLSVLGQGLKITTTTPSSGILTSLVAAWNLSDTSDASGRGNTLTNNNTATFNTGLIGNALYTATASSQYASLAGTTADIKMGDIDFTIVADVYFTTLPLTGNGYSLVTKDVDTPANSRDYTLDCAETEVPGHFVLRLYINGSATILARSAVEVSSGTWYHVAAWHDAAANTVNIQVDNNTPVSVTTGGVSPQDSSAQFRIGARAYSGFEAFHNGRIDNVGMWKRTLTSTERTCLFNSGASKEYPYSGC